MRFDHPSLHPQPDPWPAACYKADGTRFWNEHGCHCDNGDMKPHHAYCDWHPREMKLFDLLHDPSFSLIYASDEWRRVARMDPEQFAAAFPDDPYVVKQRLRQQREHDEYWVARYLDEYWVARYPVPEVSAAST